MAASFTLILDTAGPAGVTVSINSGATYSASQGVTVNVSTADGGTSGYQMKLYGDVDGNVNANIQPSEAASSWIAYSPNQFVTLSAANGLKTVRVRVRDEVFNESPEATSTITLDTTAPTITLGAPDVNKVSKVIGKRVAAASFSTNRELAAWKVKIVPSESSLESAGTLIPETNGSTNMSGGAVAANGTVNITIDGRDIELASPGDGPKIIKVFGEDTFGNWSV